MTVANSSSPLNWKGFVFGRNPKRTAIRAVVLAVTSLLLFRFILLPVRIMGISMEPTYRNGTVNFVNRFAYRWHPPQRGDVVAIKTSGLHILYFKRTIGLPGETVAISNGIVLINDQPLREPWVRYREPWQVPPCKLGADEYFFIGDNRGMPQQQHEFGRAGIDRIAGKVLW